MVQTSRYVLAYLLWAISVAIAVMTLLSWRSSAMIILGVTQWDRYLEHALNQFGFLFLAIFSLCVIVFTEYYYRTGVEKGRLFIRFFLVTFIELLFLSAAHGARYVGGRMLEINMAGTIPFVIGEAALCALAFVLYQRAKTNFVEPEITA